MKRREYDADALRAQWLAREIEAGRCPWRKLSPGARPADCPMGFPGCYCGNEIATNSNLAEISVIDWLMGGDRNE